MTADGRVLRRPTVRRRAPRLRPEAGRRAPLPAPAGSWGGMRSDLDTARGELSPLVPPAGFGQGRARRPASHGPRPTRPRGRTDVVGTFTDRMHAILQSAEEEAAEIRNKARAAVRAEKESVRAELADLLRQRDALRAEVARLRGQANALRAVPGGRSGPEAEAGTRQGRRARSKSPPVHRRPPPGAHRAASTLLRRVGHPAAGTRPLHPPGRPAGSTRLRVLLGSTRQRHPPGRPAGRHAAAAAGGQSGGPHAAAGGGQSGGPYPAAAQPGGSPPPPQGGRKRGSAAQPCLLGGPRPTNSGGPDPLQPGGGKLGLHSARRAPAGPVRRRAPGFADAPRTQRTALANVRRSAAGGHAWWTAARRAHAVRKRNPRRVGGSACYRHPRTSAAIHASLALCRLAQARLPAGRRPSGAATTRSAHGNTTPTTRRRDGPHPRVRGARARQLGGPAQERRTRCRRGRRRAHRAVRPLWLSLPAATAGTGTARNPASNRASAGLGSPFGRAASGAAKGAPPADPAHPAGAPGTAGSRADDARPPADQTPRSGGPTIADGASVRRPARPPRTTRRARRRASARLWQARRGRTRADRPKRCRIALARPRRAGTASRLRCRRSRPARRRRNPPGAAGQPVTGSAERSAHRSQAPRRLTGSGPRSVAVRSTSAGSTSDGVRKKKGRTPDRSASDPFPGSLPSPRPVEAESRSRGGVRARRRGEGRGGAIHRRVGSGAVRCGLRRGGAHSGSSNPTRWCTAGACRLPDRSRIVVDVEPGGRQQRGVIGCGVIGRRAIVGA